jgi:hypothetical protein
MPSLANVNLSIMQGDVGRKVQNLRNFVQDSSQQAAAQQQGQRDEEIRVTIQHAQDADRARFKKERGETPRKKKRKRSTRQPEAHQADETTPAPENGHRVDVRV